jgi:hypothetical protein
VQIEQYFLIIIINNKRPTKQSCIQKIDWSRRDIVIVTVTKKVVVPASQNGSACITKATLRGGAKNSNC